MIPLLSYKIYRDKHKNCMKVKETKNVNDKAKTIIRHQCKCCRNKRTKTPNYLEMFILLFGMFGVPLLYGVYCGFSRLYLWKVGETGHQEIIQLETLSKTEQMSPSLRSVIAERLKNKYKYSFEHSWTEIDRRSGLSAEEFKDMYSGKWPVIITDCGSTWPALKKWNKEFFLKNHGKELVSVKTYADGVQETFLMPLDLYLSHLDDGYPQEWTYINDEMFIPSRPHLEDDIGTCKELGEDFFKLFPIEVRPWWSFLLWGTRYSRSDLHIDPFNWTGTIMVLSGLKRWKLFPPGQDHLLHVIPDQQYKFPINFYKYNSYVDCFNNEHLLKFPSIGTAKVIEFYQYPGELLIIPPGWFHQAFNEEITLAVSGQLMNKDNYKVILEELYKGGEIKREAQSKEYNGMSVREEVERVLARISKETIRRGREITLSVYEQTKALAESSGLPRPPLVFERFER